MGADFVPFEESAVPCDTDVLDAERGDSANKHRLDLFDWLKNSLSKSFDESSTVDALVACVEVVLGDDFPIQEEALMDTIAVLTGEGVPQHVVEEFKERAM